MTRKLVTYRTICPLAIKGNIDGGKVGEDILRYTVIQNYSSKLATSQSILKNW